LFVKQNASNANVLFIFDSSGSMRGIIYHVAYDGSVVYSGAFTSTDKYSVSSAGNYSPDDFLGNGDVTPTAPLVPSEAGQSSQYYGNYMNWLYYHATDAQRAEIPQVTRIEVAKAVLAGIVLENTDIRFGLMKFNGEDGGQLVSNMGSAPADLITDTNAITAGGYTPLAETMVDALTYLQTSGAGAPIEFECQKTFIILLTDGSPTRDLNVPAYIGDWDGDGREPGDCTSIGAEEDNSANCSDHLDDVAGYMFTTDLRGDLDGDQVASTYTIGLSIDIPLLQQAADNGGGRFYRANNADELQASLASVFADILKRTSSGTGVALVSKENSGDNRLYRAKFVPGIWNGYLEAFATPYTDGDLPVWEAGALLSARSASSRDIYTSTGGVFRSFDDSNTNDIMPYLNEANATLAAEIINHTRGEDIAGYRNRLGWKLGDIVESSPVVVGDPAYYYDFGNYKGFASANAGREPVVYVGANDGMLHCFRASDGYEMWSYISQTNLGKLKELAQATYCHDFFVNSTPKVADVQVGGNWMTALVCGQGEGGDGYFALDVTDPSSPDLLWDVSLPTVVESRAIPQIARVTSPDGFVAFVGSGPDTTGEAHLVALDMENGAVLWQDLLSTVAGVNVTTAPVTLDMDFDGYDDLLYVNDMSGKLWRFDLTTSPWTKSLLYDSGQPIQARPAVTIDEQMNVLVYFGTGRYLELDDITDTSDQSFYCIIDDHSGSTVSNLNIVDQTSSITPLSATDRGWRIDLIQAGGERVTSASTLVGGVVYFTSFQPNSDQCGAGGISWLYSADYKDGSSPDDDYGNENDTTTDRITDLDEGISSQPVFDLSAEEIIIQSSDGKLSILDSKSSVQRIVVRSWREIFQ